MRDETVSNLREILGDRYDDMIDKAMAAPRFYATRQYTIRDRVADMLAAVLPGLLAEHRAEANDLRAMLAGRCLSDIMHRDDEHRQSVCMLPAEHAPLMHDDCMGCTWTDADHWQPSAVDRVADEGYDSEELDACCCQETAS